MNAKPEDDQDEAGDLLEQELVRANDSPTAAAPAPSSDEDGDEAGDEREARDDDAPRRRRARRAAPPRPTRPRRGSPGRAAARRGRGTRRSPAPKATRTGGAASFEAGELVVEPALERGVERLGRRRPALAVGVAAVAPAPGEQSRRATAPTREPGERQHPRDQSKPFFGGSASTAGPNWSTSGALISLFVSPAAIRSRMNAFIRSATGAFGVVERRLADGADELRLELGRGRLLLARGCGRRRGRARAPRGGRNLTPARAPARSRRRGPRRLDRACDPVAHLAGRVDEVRLRESR